MEQYWNWGTEVEHFFMLFCYVMLLLIIDFFLPITYKHNSRFFLIFSLSCQHTNASDSITHPHFCVVYDVHCSTDKTETRERKREKKIVCNCHNCHYWKHTYKHPSPQTTNPTTANISQNPELLLLEFNIFKPSHWWWWWFYSILF